MQKYSKFRHSLKSLERGTSLGLQTPTSFELQLLELAAKGRKLFENSWNEQATLDEQVMFLEILQEIQLWEKAGCNKLLAERARNVVVRMKDHKSLHQRALVVYRDFLGLMRSCTGRDSSSQNRKGESTDDPGSLVQSRDEESSPSQALTLDEKFKKVMSIEFPETDDDESSISKELCLITIQGESSRSSCELLYNCDEISAESLSIFRKPTETDECDVTPFDFTHDKLSKIDSSAEICEPEDPTLAPENRGFRFTQLCLGDEPPPRLEKIPEQKESKEFSFVNGEKIDFVVEQIPQLLGNMSEKDLKFQIWWTVDGVICRAKSIADLRNKHNVLVEGPFRKRCRSRIWKSYYGFILDAGVMLYFRNGVFKKVADFRKCGHILPKVEQCSLNIEDLLLDSRVTNWIIKLASKKICKTWYGIIVNITRSEVNGFHDSLCSV